MMQSDESLLQNELVIDNVAQVHLKETAMWAKFLGIAGFIGSGFYCTGGNFFRQHIQHLHEPPPGK